MADTFAKAFAAARKAKGPGKTFEWNGKSYSTNTKEDAKGGGSARPKARPADKAPKPAAAGGARPAPGGAGKLPAAKPKAAPARAAQFEPTTKPTQGPKPAAKPATNADRMEAAKAEAAAARAKTRAAAGIGAAKPAAAKPQSSGNAGGALKAVKDFFAGGGLAGKWERERKAKAKG